MPKLSPSALAKRLRRIRLLVCDVDGVLTDGGVYIGESGESKRFSIRDGMGLRCCQMAGIKTAWVSARPSKVTTRRAKELKTDFIAQTKDGKVPAINKILSRTGFTWDEIAMMGEDIVDLPAMAKVGVASNMIKYMPELENTWGYPILMISMLFIGLILVLFMRRKGWF